MMYYTNSWDLHPDTCPCDLEFCEFMEQVVAPSGAAQRVFHFGTGNHHTVGLRLARLCYPVLGITAGRDEQDAYEQLVIERPTVARYYQCFFNDIYILNSRLLPTFTFITLFHLGEWTESERDGRQAYLAMSDEELILMMIKQLDRYGTIVFYEGSNGWDRIKGIVDKLYMQAVLVPDTTYKSLLMYRRYGER